MVLDPLWQQEVETPYPWWIVPASIVGGLVFAQLLALPLVAFADCTLGFNDPNPKSGYSMGYGPAEGGLDGAQPVTAACTGYLSELHWKGWKQGNPTWNPVVWVWDTATVASGQCAAFAGPNSSTICPKNVIAKTNETPGITGTEYNAQNVTSVFATSVFIEQGKTYWLDARPEADEQSTVNWYGIYYSPIADSQSAFSWKRGTGGTTAGLWWPDMHSGLHLYGTVVEGASPPPPPPPSPATITIFNGSATMTYSCTPIETD